MLMKFSHRLRNRDLNLNPSRSQSSSPTKQRIALSPSWLTVLITLLALALHGLNVLDRSMWPDEGVTYLRLEGSYADILTNLLKFNNVYIYDTHPPFYFLVLKVWVFFVGDSEFALKWFSVLAAAVSVPLCYVLGKRIFGPWAGVWASLLVASSAGMHWYSHEVRMYTFIVCVAATCTYCLCRAIAPSAHRVRWWLAWAVLCIVAITTHYTFAGLVFAHGLFVIGLVLAQWRTYSARTQKNILILAIATALAGLLVLLVPAIQNLLKRLSSGSELNYVFNPLDVLIWSEINGFFLGISTPNAHWWGFEILTWGTALVCLIWVLLNSKNNLTTRVLLWLSFGMPMVFWWGLSFIKPNYQGFRHLMLVVPFIAVSLAGFLMWLRNHGAVLRTISTVLCALVLAANAYGLAYASWVRSPTWHDDWRGLAHAINNEWQIGDSVLIPSPTHGTIVQRYLPSIPITTRLGFLERPGPVQADAAAEFVQAHPRVWAAVLSNQYRDFLLQHYRERRIVGLPSRTVPVQVHLYERIQVIDKLPATAQPIAAPGANAGLALAGFEIHSPADLNSQPHTVLSLYWQRTADIPNSDWLSKLNIALNISAENQNWWQWNLPAELNNAPDSERWPLNQLWRIDYVVPLPLGLPQLNYRLNLKALQGDKSELYQQSDIDISPTTLACCIRLVQWPPSTAKPIAPDPSNLSPLYSPLQRPLPDNANDLVTKPQLSCNWWQAADAALARVEFPSTSRYGEFLPVVLTWCATNQTASAGTWETHLSLRALLADVATISQTTGTAAFPITAWPPNEPVRDQYALAIPPDLSRGWYRLMLERFRSGQRVDQVMLGIVQVTGYDVVPLPDPIAHPVQASAGELQLLGYSNTQNWSRGQAIDIHTYWRATATPSREGVLFVHIVPPNATDGRPIAQDDNIPENGTRNSKTYRDGETLDQTHRVILPNDAPGGEYKLYAGVYDRNKDCCRWEVNQNSQRPPNDLIYMGSFTLPDLPDTTPFDQNLFLPAVTK